MAKKKLIETASTLVEETTVNIYSKEKYEELLSIVRNPLPTKQQKDNILLNYQIYIDPKQTKYTESCSSCSGSIGALFGKLRDFFNQNIDKFEK